MAKLDIEDIRRKVNSLAGYINTSTRTPKVKYALLEEYKRGRFHDIPSIYLTDDPEFVDKLEKLFVNSDSIKQRVPLGLLNRDAEASRRVLSSIAMKLESGIDVDTSGVFERKESIIFEDANLLETIKDILIDFNYSTLNGMYYMSNSNKILPERISHKEEPLGDKVNVNEKFDREYINEKKDNFKINLVKALLKIKIGLRPKSPPVVALPSKYQWIGEEDYLERKLCDELRGKYQDEFLRIELENFDFGDDELSEFLSGIGPFFKDEAVLSDDINSKENLILQKEFLLRIVRNLDKIGALNELVRQENLNIKSLNRLILDGDRIKEISKDDIYKTIDNFDLENPEDTIKMLILNRQLTNKLAHNYVAFIYTGLYMNCVGDDVFSWKKRFKAELDNIRVEREAESEANLIIKSLDKAKIIYKQELDRKIKERDDKVAKLRMEGKDEEADNLSKERVKVDNSFFETQSFIALYRKYDSDIGKLRNMIANNNPKTNENIRSNIRSIKEKEAKKYLIKDDKLQYCVDIYAELADIMKKYNDLNKDANDIVKREAFHDLVARILRSRGEKNKYSYLELTVGGKTYNVGKKLEELIDRVTSDGIIKEPSRVLSSITKRMDFIQLFFSCKHLFTKELVNASERYPDLLRVENAPLSSKLNKEGKVVGVEPGVVDIYYKGALQVFGGHYKEDDPEVSDEKIQSLPAVNSDVTEAFKVVNPKTGDSFLATYIPFFHVTDKQLSEIKESLRDIEYMENNRDGENTNNRYKQLRQNEKSNPIQFEFARKRSQILTDDSRFSKEKTNRPLNRATYQELEREQNLTRIQTSLAEICISELLKGTPIEELEKEFSREVIDYAQKHARERSYVLEGIEQTKPGESIDHNCVAAAMRNGHFTMAIDYKNVNQEAIRFNNHLTKEMDDEKKQ